MVRMCSGLWVAAPRRPDRGDKGEGIVKREGMRMGEGAF